MPAHELLLYNDNIKIDLHFVPCNLRNRLPSSLVNIIATRLFTDVNFDLGIVLRLAHVSEAESALHRLIYNQTTVH